MIKYDTGRMGLLFILSCRGSVFPKAFLMAFPNAVLALMMHRYLLQQGRDEDDSLFNMKGVDWLWAGFTSILSFLIVFRNNQAYTRFWEGATLIHQVRGEWFDAVSTLFAFTNQAPEFEKPVKAFRLTLVRLASMLYCSALQQVCEFDDDRFEIIENRGMDAESVCFMQDCHDRVEVIMQWIQRLIVDAHGDGTIDIASPLLTRAFQELSQGVVTLNNARKIKDIPFPFPYSQMITAMMLVHWVATPVIASKLVSSPAVSACICFLVTCVLWCQIYITMEIDQPFGEDANDLPLRRMQKEFNMSLLTLLHPVVQSVPRFDDAPPPDSERTGSYRFTTLSESVAKFAEKTEHPGLGGPGPWQVGFVMEQVGRPSLALSKTLSVEATGKSPLSAVKKRMKGYTTSLVLGRRSSLCSNDDQEHMACESEDGSAASGSDAVRHEPSSERSGGPGAPFWRMKRRESDSTWRPRGSTASRQSQSTPGAGDAERPRGPSVLHAEPSSGGEPDQPCGSVAGHSQARPSGSDPDRPRGSSPRVGQPIAPHGGDELDRVGAPASPHGVGELDGESAWALAARQSQPRSVSPRTQRQHI